jgi:hypothetical protein
MSLFRLRKSAPVVVVTISDRQGRDTVDSEVRAATLEELFRACRDAPPSKLVRVSISGPEGEVRLNFASFRNKE